MYAVRSSPEEEMLTGDLKEPTGQTISDIIRAGTMRCIDDEIDADIIRKTVAEYKADPETYSFDDEMKRLGLE